MQLNANASDYRGLLISRGKKYKCRRCGIFVLETAIHQMTVKCKLLHVPLWPSVRISVNTIMNAVKYKTQNFKLFIKHDKQPKLLKIMVNE